MPDLIAEKQERLFQIQQIIQAKKAQLADLKAVASNVMMRPDVQEAQYKQKMRNISEPYEPGMSLVDVGQEPPRAMPEPEFDYGRGLGTLAGEAAQKYLPSYSEDTAKKVSKRLAHLFGTREPSTTITGAAINMPASLARAGLGMAGFMGDIATRPDLAAKGLYEMGKESVHTYKEIYNAAAKGDEDAQKWLLDMFKQQPVELAFLIGIPLHVLVKGVHPLAKGKFGGELNVPEIPIETKIARSITAKEPVLRKKAGYDTQAQGEVVRGEQVGQEPGRPIQKPESGVETAETGRILQKTQEIEPEYIQEARARMGDYPASEEAVLEVARNLKEADQMRVKGGRYERQRAKDIVEQERQARIDEIERQKIADYKAKRSEKKAEQPVPEKPAPKAEEAKKAAEEHGIKYDSYYEDFDRYSFTDPLTDQTFMVDDLANTGKLLAESRASLEKSRPPAIETSLNNEVKYNGKQEQFGDKPDVYEWTITREGVEPTTFVTEKLTKDAVEQGMKRKYKEMFGKEEPPEIPKPKELTPEEQRAANKEAMKADMAKGEEMKIWAEAFAKQHPEVEYQGYMPKVKADGKPGVHQFRFTEKGKEGNFTVTNEEINKLTDIYKAEKEKWAAEQPQTPETPTAETSLKETPPPVAEGEHPHDIKISKVGGGKATQARGSGGAAIRAGEKPEESTSLIGMPKSMEPKSTKPVRAYDIKKHFERKLDIPIRLKHMGSSRAAGFYKPWLHVVRTKQPYDIPVITHEIAHGLDWKFGIRKNFRGHKELQKLDYDYPKKKRVHEGFAEFVRHWMTTGEHKKLAPEFTKQWNKWLEEHPKEATILREGRELIRKYKEQGAVERVYSQIDMEGKATRGPLKERIGQKYRQVRRLFDDDLHTLEYAEKKMRGVKKLDPLKIDPAHSPTMLARADAKTAAAKAHSMVMDGTFNYAGEKTGISLREALAPIKKSEQKDFVTYAYAARALDLIKRHKNAGIDIKDANYVYKKFDSPKFRKALEEVTNFEDRVLEYVVESGHLAREAKDIIRQLNPIHIPLKRVFEDAWGMTATTGGKRIGNVPKAVKTLKGSGRMIENPWQSIIESTAQMIQIADKTRIARELVNLAYKTKTGKWVEKIPQEKVVRSITIKEIKKILEEKHDLTIQPLWREQHTGPTPKADLEGIISLYENKPTYFGKENIVTFWEDGKRHWYELDPELYKAIQAVDVPNKNMLIKIFAPAARLQRLGATGLQAGFSFISNPVKDAFTFALQTEYGRAFRGTTAQAKGLATKLRLRDQKYNELFLRSGSDMSTMIGLDKAGIKKTVREVLNSDKKARALNVVKHPIEALKTVFSATESATRLAEYESAHKALIEQWKSPVSARVGAATAAADVTVNFRRMGVYGAVINDIIPFWNAAIQGSLKMGRFVRENPKKALTRSAAMITAPTITLWWLHKDEQWYKDLPDWQKYGFWNFKVRGEIVRIPRPFEWGYVFGSTPEAVLNYWYEQDPEKLKKAMGEMVSTSSPDFIPAAVKPLIEVTTNYDYFKGRPLISPYALKKPPELQYHKWTPETYKKLAVMLNYVPAIEMSPVQIEHLIEAYTGGLGGDIVQTAEDVVTAKKPETMADYPVIGRIFSRPVTPEKKERHLKYDMTDVKTRIRAWLKAGKRTEAMKEWREWNKRHPDMLIPASILSGGR